MRQKFDPRDGQMGWRCTSLSKDLLSGQISCASAEVGVRRHRRRYLTSPRPRDWGEGKKKRKDENYEMMSGPRPPPPLITRHLDIVTIVVLILNRCHAVYRRGGLKLNSLGPTRPWSLMLLEDALGRAGVNIGICWVLQCRVVALVCPGIP